MSIFSKSYFSASSREFSIDDLNGFGPSYDVGAGIGGLTWGGDLSDRYYIDRPLLVLVCNEDVKRKRAPTSPRLYRGFKS